MRRPNTVGVTACSSLLLLSACTTGPNGPGLSLDTNQETCSYSVPASALFSAALGLALGAAVGGRHNRGAFMAAGAAGGALIGGSIATYLQNRCETIRAAQAQMRATQLAYEKIAIPPAIFPQNQQPQNDDNSGVAVTAVDPSMFAIGSDQLSPTGEADMIRLAQAFTAGSRRILIVGHTDSTGSADENIRLSERRAITVAHLFERAGIPAWRLYYKGAGDTEPVDTNATEQGRARNRRVEVVELGNEQSIVAYNTLRQSDPQFMQRRIENRTVERAPRPSRSPGAPSPQAQAQTAAEAGRLPAMRSGERFDFGGSPVSPAGVSLAQYVGHQDQTAQNGIFDSLIPSAWADNPHDGPLLRTSCIADRDIEVVTVKSLATGQIVSRPISEYVPGLYGSSWTKNINHNLVAITGVAVQASGGRVDIPPRLLVFENYRPGDQKPSLNAVGGAEAYIGEKGVLYRVFVDARAWPLRCIDMVFDRANADKVAFGRLYYEKLGEVYAVDFQPSPSRLVDRHAPGS